MPMWEAGHSLGSAEENDENLQPGQTNIQDRPNDEDRVRFGFKQRMPLAPPSPIDGSQLDGDAVSEKPVQPSWTPALTASFEHVDLQQFIRDTLGDPDEVLSVLKMKPTAGKYDFKDKITDLQDMIQPLKKTLSDQRLKCKALVDALGGVETDINGRFHTCGVEITCLRAALGEARADLTAVRQEAAERALDQQQLRASLEEVKRQGGPLRDRVASEARRADEAEAQLAYARREIEVARSEAKKQSELALEAVRQREAMKEDCKLQISEAAELLRRQVGEAALDRQELLIEARRREDSLAAELDSAKSQILDLEAQLSAMAAVRDELSESKVCLREQIAELGTVAQERDLSFSAEMKQKEAETEQREADFRARIQEKEQEMDRREASFRAELAEKEQLLALSDAEMCASREADTAQHRQQLGDMEASLRQTEVEASDRVGVLQAQHQTELAEKDELFRLKELHAHENLESVKKLHQAQLEEKERAVARKLVQKDAETNEMLESLRIVHQTHLHEKDATISQKDVDARDSIESIRRMHQAQVSNMEELLQQKDVDMKEGLGSLKAMHQAQLHELEERLKRKDADSKDSTASIKSWHQAQISKMEELIKQKDADMQESMESMRNVHQAQLFEKEELLSQKDASLKEEISSLKRSHQSQLDEKDELLQQKESSFREALESMKLQHQARVDEAEENLRQKDAYLRESLQSNQLLQSSSSEQLKLEQQRVQRLEAEVQSLRALEEDLRAGATVTTRQAERLEAELSSSRDQLLELRSTLQRSETEREQQLERASERQATLQEENIQLKVKVGVLQEELAGVKASAKAKGEQVDRLEQHRDSLEVEFRSYKEHHGTSNLQQMEAITELRLTVDKLSKQVDFTKIELTAQQGSLGQQQGYIQSLQNDLANGESIRRELHNTIQELKGNIRVFCRVRPHLEGEDAAKALQSPEAGKLNLNHMGENYNFAFDRVFDDSSTQEAVFDEVSGLVQSALDGYKVCIFAYGQTGSGKTYTMQGSQERSSWGLIPRALSKIFQASETMRSAGWEWTLRASFLEVYNEALRDLLTGTSDSSSSGLVHVIKHDDAWGTMVTNLTSVQVESLDHIHKLMEKASKSRAVGSTDMNATSSRSHSVFALYLHGVNRELNSELHGALHLVDLAGSERLDRSGATGERLKETQNINRSLSSLADVFLAKAEGRSHVPFRNSKLTHLMEPCLNGQGKTLMVVNVGPEQDNSHETLCALRFAGQVSHCNTGGKPKRSTRPASAAVAAPSRLQSPALSLRPQSAASAATAAQTLRRAGR